ncbi:hypothetical protein BC829DRAFT_417333 [Chytridium lagenaria]|nr:hypothetical protein BC829DRAFT_417333 [Chytridium lagenaria]
MVTTNMLLKSLEQDCAGKFTLESIETGVLEISFVGQSVVYFFCDDTAKGVLLPDFNPLEVPVLVVAGSKTKTEREAESRRNCARRLEAMYHHGGQQIKAACLEGFDETFAEENTPWAATAKPQQPCLEKPLHHWTMKNGL